MVRIKDAGQNNPLRSIGIKMVSFITYKKLCDLKAIVWKDEIIVNEKNYFLFDYSA